MNPDPKIQARIDAIEKRREVLNKKHKADYANAMQTTQRWYEREMRKVAEEIAKRA